MVPFIRNKFAKFSTSMKQNREFDGNISPESKVTKITSICYRDIITDTTFLSHFATVFFLLWIGFSDLNVIIIAIKVLVVSHNRPQLLGFQESTCINCFNRLILIGRAAILNISTRYILQNTLSNTQCFLLSPIEMLSNKLKTNTDAV